MRSVRIVFLCTVHISTSPKSHALLPRGNYRIVTFLLTGRDSSVGIATSYGLDGPGIESWQGRGFPHQSRPALGPTQPSVQWIPGHSREYSGRSMALTTHPV
jgi:hypothetical protein